MSEEIEKASTAHVKAVVEGCDLAKEGYDVIRRCGNLVSDIGKLNALEGMENVSFAGRHAEMTGAQAKEDIALFVEAVMQIGAVLEADDAKLAKAMARLSIYGV